MNNPVVLVVWIGMLVAMMYFMIFLPQKKRKKKEQELIASLAVGNTITTIGGIVGKVINIKDDEVIIESSVEKTQIKVKKWAVRDVEKPVEA